MLQTCRLESLETRRLLSGYPIGLGSTGADGATDVITDRSDNVIVVGSFTGTVDFDPSATVNNLTGGGAFVAKYASPASGGGLVWARRFTGAAINAVGTDRDGSVYLAGNFAGTVDFDPRTGTFNLTSVGGTDMFLVKLSPKGNLVYADRFGGTLNDKATAMAVTTNAQAVVAGTFQGAADFDPSGGTYTVRSTGGDDGIVIHINETGALQWAGSFGGFQNEVVADMVVGDQGQAVVCGTYEGVVDFNPSKATGSPNNAGTKDAFAFQWDSNGQYQWIAGMGGVDKDFATGVDVDEVGNVYTTGNFQNLADFNPLANGTFNMTAPATGGVFVTKLDNSGGFIWAKQIAGAGDIDTGAGDINVDKNHNVFVNGVFSGTRDFDPGAGTSNLTSAGGNDIYVASLTSGGNFNFAKQIGSTGNETADALVLSRSNQIVSVGAFPGTVDFDPGAGTVNLVSNGDTDFYVWELALNGTILS